MATEIDFNVCIAHDCESFVFAETTCRQPTVATGYGELIDETQYTSTLEIFDADDKLIKTFTNITPSAAQVSYLFASSEVQTADLNGVYNLRYTVTDTQGVVVGYKDLVAVFDCCMKCVAEEFAAGVECGCSACFEKNAIALDEWTRNYNFGKILANIGMIEEATLALNKAAAGLGEQCKCP